MNASGLARVCTRLCNAPTRQILRPNSLIKNTVRNSHGTWVYRTAPPKPAKHLEIMTELVGGFMWWWVLYHIYTEPGHIIGEWDKVTPAKWTDAELGIPPDSEGPAERINM